MPTKRSKGKIPRSEWSVIVGRRAAGESLARIARDYDCSAPAIRYIVEQWKVRSAMPRAPDGARESGGAPDNAPARRPMEEEAPPAGELGSAALATVSGMRERVSSDIASFLVVFDSALISSSPENVARLLAATDRLMRAAARIRIELERLDEAEGLPPHD
jgi:hypothetical protein